MRAFDPVQHHRRLTRLAEARADALDRHRVRLERLLALALNVATANERECPNTQLLVALEELDAAVDRPGPTIDDLVALLRKTDPDTTSKEVPK